MTIKGILVETYGEFGHVGDYVGVDRDGDVYIVTNGKDETIVLNQEGLDNLIDCDFCTCFSDDDDWDDEDDWFDPDGYDDYDDLPY